MGNVQQFPSAGGLAMPPGAVMQIAAETQVQMMTEQRRITCVQLAINSFGVEASTVKDDGESFDIDDAALVRRAAAIDAFVTGNTDVSDPTLAFNPPPPAGEPASAFLGDGSL